MARAAVRAKQAQQAQAAQAANASRKQRKHASGGNPNQDLFFMRLRRKQKWVFAFLIVTFLVAFVFLGVGSGNGGGLESLYNGIFGGGGDAVGQAKAEIKKDPLKGYKDLASAYVTKGDLTNAAGALNSYLNLKKKDWSVWEQLGGYQKQIGDTAAGEWQQAQQNGQLQSPGSAFQPTGPLAGQLGSNPIDDYYSQQNQSVIQPLLQKALDAYKASLTALDKAAKYAPPSRRAGVVLLAAGTAKAEGDSKAELAALKRYVALAPNSPNIKSIIAECKSLGGSCTPKSSK